MVILAPTHTNSVILHHISWNTFERILLETGGDRHHRFAYNQGILEIMTPLMPHEHNKRLLEKIIDTLVEELNLNVKSTGSLTCKREDLARGVEPDSSFYIQNEPIMRPDLVIEVDYASSSIDKLPIYLALGVPEVWRYNEPVMQIYSLSEDKYIPCNGSPTFANLPLNTEVPRFLASSLQVGEVSMIKNFRSWLKTQTS
ncbi:Uma2 family endonuclease [Cronbergia sp. UHCC 0137]|uniref:Uma2 family endonuclease n=1 Tax=Cronbergia sp. UHCC 0137 TaxID=3110239 RepID=UPI002B1F974B|nr:Uma2 family endonuclease [Cronbergia sp. UHCC 0137]MEA5620772.1 Uma2 family endonuclease [Cronbergia sp. UHCC 0137]